MKRISKFIVGLVALILFAWGGLNTTGFCIPERRYLTDAEQIEVALNNVYHSHIADYKYRSGVGSSGPLVKYADFEEFKALNIDCCSLTPVANEGFRGSTMRRVFGTFRAFVDVKYREENTSGDQTSNLRKEVFIAVTNCGRTTDLID